MKLNRNKLGITTSIAVCMLILIELFATGNQNVRAQNLEDFLVKSALVMWAIYYSIDD